MQQRMCNTDGSVCEISVQSCYERMTWRHLLKEHCFGDKQVKI